MGFWSFRLGLYTQKDLKREVRVKSYKGADVRIVN